MKKRWISLILAIIMTLSLLPVIPATAVEAPDMHVSEAFLGVLKKMEGFYSKPYWDYAQYSIGYGSFCSYSNTDPMYKHYMANPITEEQATELLIQELADFERSVNDFIKENGLTLKQHQYDALVSFSYNCGAGWTGEKSGYLNAAVRQGDISNALIYGMCLWSTAGGNYILIPRRMSEANMYINGEYKSYTEGDSYPATFKYVFLDGNGGTVKYTIHGYNAADPAGIVTDFKEIPTGKDANGKWFAYTFAGWFTAPEGGTQVKVLDGTLNNGTILYAQWKDPSGKVVSLPKGEVMNDLAVKVTSNVNVRTGPGTFYPVNYTIQATSAQPKTIMVTEVFNSGSTTWGKFAEGWLSLSYTNYNEVISGLPGEPFPRAATMLRDKVNFRTEPNTASQSMGTLAVDTKITITEEFWEEGARRLWGKMDNGYWVCMDNAGTQYAVYDSEISATVTGISMGVLPKKVKYIQKNEELNINGSVLLIHYSDGSVKARTVARELTKGFDNSKLGKKTITVRYLGFETTFEVEVVKATVTFKNYDGTVLSQQQYAYGEAVNAPGVPTKPEDDLGAYRFVGWDKEIATCTGNAEYTAVFEMIPGTQKYIPGDINGDSVVDEDDVIYLLRYVVFPEQYPVLVPADYAKDNIVNEDDVIYLLRHVVFPEQYPLASGGNEGNGEAQ